MFSKTSCYHFYQCAFRLDGEHLDRLGEHLDRYPNVTEIGAVLAELASNPAEQDNS